MLYNFFLLNAKKTTTNENFIYHGSSSSKYKCPNIGCKCPYNGRPKLLLFFPVEPNLLRDHYNEKDSSGFHKFKKILLLDFIMMFLLEINTRWALSQTKSHRLHPTKKKKKNSQLIY